MSVLVISNVDKHAEVDWDDCIHFHNGFGWFLDSIFGGEELPHSFFSQAIGPGNHPDPGPLDVEQAHEFASAIEKLTDHQLEDRMWAALNGREADEGMEPAIGTVRKIAELARRGHGLSVR